MLTQRRRLESASEGVEKRREKETGRGAAASFARLIVERKGEERYQAANELHKYLTGRFRDESTHFQHDFVNYFDSKADSFASSTLYELMNAKEDRNEKDSPREAATLLIVVLAESLMNVEGGKRVLTLAHYLLKVIIKMEEPGMELVARALSFLIQTSKVYGAELMEKCLDEAFEWSRDEYLQLESARLASSILLRELALFTSTAFFLRADTFFTSIFQVMRSPKTRVRVAAAASLRATLTLTSQREARDKRKWYSTCYQEAIASLGEKGEKGDGMGKEERVHSMLLTINELLRIADAAIERERVRAVQSMVAPRRDTVLGSPLEFISAPRVQSTVVESRTAARLIQENIPTILERVLEARTCKQQFVVTTLIEILPRLSIWINSSQFVTCLESLLPLMPKHPTSLLSLGLLIVQNRTLSKKYVVKMISFVKDSLHSVKKKKNEVSNDSNIFTLLTLIVRSYGRDIAVDVKEILPLILNCPLSNGVKMVLHEFYLHFEHWRADVMNGLIHQLSTILIGESILGKAIPSIKSLPSIKVDSSPESVHRFEMAMETLGEFQFNRSSLHVFIQYIAEGYLVCDSPPLRISAAKCCISMLRPFIEEYETVSRDQRLAMQSLIQSVLKCLVTVSVVDSDASVRLCVIGELSKEGSSLLSLLSQPHLLEFLRLSLRDEKLEIQEASVGLMSKIGMVAPPLVLPRLRRVLLETIGLFTHSRDAKIEEHSARLISQMTIQCPKFMRPYLGCVMEALIPKLAMGDGYGETMVHLLNTMSELAIVGGSEIVESIPVILPPLITLITHNGSVSRREAALRAMCLVCSSTTFAVDVYREFPHLLPILLSLMKSEMSQSMRRLVMRVLGTLGAIDPYTYKSFTGAVSSEWSGLNSGLSIPTSKRVVDSRQDLMEMFYYGKFSLDHFCSSIAIANLMRMLESESYESNYGEIIRVLMQVVTNLGDDVPSFVSELVPTLISITKKSKKELREFFLIQLASLVSIMKTQSTEYLDRVFSLMATMCKEDANYLLTVVQSINTIASSLRGEMGPFVSEVIPYLVEGLKEGRESDTTLTLTSTSLGCIRCLAGSLSCHLHLLIPPLLAIIVDSSREMGTRRDAIQTLQAISEKEEVDDFSPRIIQVWTKSLAVKDLQGASMSLLRLMLREKWKHVQVFKRSIDGSLIANGISSPEYNAYLRENGDEMGWSEDSYSVRDESLDGGEVEEAKKVPLSRLKSLSPLKLPSLPSNPKINMEMIRRSMRIPMGGGVSTKEEWSEWMVRVREAFLRSSPSPSLRCLASLADQHTELAKDLFNASFLSVWSESTEEMQDEMSSLLMSALDSKHDQVVHTLLNLVEFVHHSDGGPLPISSGVLGKAAHSIRAYAKALRYKEMEVMKDKNGSISLDDAHALITYSNKLNLQEEAVGVIKCVEQQKGAEISKVMRSRWYEKLNEWEKSLELLNECREEGKEEGISTQELDEHECKCLEALGKWNQLNKKVESSSSLSGRMAVIGARGSWMSGDWERMEEYTERVNENTLDGSYLRAVKALHNQDYQRAHLLVEKCRDMHDVQVSGMATESYSRAYPSILILQELTELDEAIEYRLRPERRGRIALLWSRRLQGCNENVEQWQKLLMIRSLVLSPSEMHPLRVKFSSLCRAQKKMAMCRSQLTQLIGLPSDSALSSASHSHDRPHLSLALAKQLWVDEYKEAAISRLSSLSRSLDRWPMSLHSEETKTLTAKIFLKLGEWTEVLQSHVGPSMPRRTTGITKDSSLVSARISALEAVRSGTADRSQREEAQMETLKIIHYYSKATEYDEGWHKGWHRLATAYFDVLSREKTKEKDGSEGEKRSRTQYAIEAVRAFTKALQLAKGSRLEDTLRLLSLWFEYGEEEEVYEELRQSNKSLPLQMWLEVIPQVMARLHSSSKCGLLLQQVVLEVGKKYPQSLVYALTVGSSSSNEKRGRHSSHILTLLSQSHPTLVSEAKMVSDELVRCAILWHELWHEALEEASNLYFTHKDVKGMLEILEPMHEMMDAGPHTLKEHSFYQTYLCDLDDARKFCLAYQRTRNGKELTQAWELYYGIFKRIAAQLKTMTSLDLNYISPILQKAKELELAVPGTFDPSLPPVTIYSFHSHLQVIPSKQRPRKMSMRGSDGAEYSFLLKGHEDPRQDQRVMQFFGLINTLLLHNGDTTRRNLTIQRYSITALSQKSGLIGWVPDCDTLHSLVKDYRDMKKMNVLMEHKVMASTSPDVDQLTLPQKMQLFQMALDSTDGEDLAQILWLKSPSSELWLERRTNYTRSMACMSIVGHILGLGDRHPSNVMLDRESGKIVHIDFGDCFEVAQTREKYPERIPFRLTRMLIKAMEISGIEGNYRLTSEKVLQVLRGKKDSLVAVLEAFVYDPLINWRLLDVNKRNPGEKKDTSKQDSNDVNEEVSRQVLDRIKLKLSGREFDVNQVVSIEDQVERLISQATSHSNLAQSYIGWCPFW